MIPLTMQRIASDLTAARRKSGRRSGSILCRRFIRRARRKVGLIAFIAIACSLPGCCRRSPETIHEASMQGDIETIRTELSHGVNVDARTRVCDESDWRSGMTPLMWAVKESKLDAASYLLDAGADISLNRDDGATALYIAAVSENTDLIELLLTRGADPNVMTSLGFTPLMAVVTSHPSPPLLASFIEHGADVNLRGLRDMTPTMAAVMASDPDTLAILIKAGADVNVMSKPGALDALLSQVTSQSFPDPGGFNALMLAVVGNDEQMARLLIEAGVDVNAENEHDQTALIYAVASENLSMVGVLIDSGADPNKQSAGRQMAIPSSAIDLAKARGGEIGDAMLERLLKVKHRDE